eukprot:scaffold29315_cov118-Isochrysis_galbana.AAC.2
MTAPRNPPSICPRVRAASKQVADDGHILGTYSRTHRSRPTPGTHRGSEPAHAPNSGAGPVFI